MAFFQNSVINKYIQNLDKPTLQTAYTKFRAHFHNATIQENIRGSKEEQYQGEFLIDLFVNVLGYTKNPTPNFNLTTEYKNVKDSKKADGAIIINEIVKAVIELKGTNTTDLNKIEVQAFGYKNNQPECEYVITSNFEKLRFYVDNAIEYLEFNLFTLTEKEFELLYICLSYDSIAKGLPKQIKDESVSQEALITKKLYNDYSVFKSELYHSLVKLNPQYEPLELFKKSQKLLDRFLFIFFAEDRQLLPTNLIFRINKEWQQLREMRIEVSLYDRYKIYFNDLDQGAKVSLPAFSQTASKQKEEFQIYAYNGGLFKKDDLLNDIKIEDDLLFLHTEKLSNYDFASEVDVNVLGHIFENSLNDVDEIKAQLEGQEIDKTKTKRKKDGVFYTPKYITKYIVDNTVGKLCLEKKEALQLTESDYTIDKKRQKKTTQALTDKLNEYRNWLLQLTICDPACGSGAFLNQALDFLITEHKYIDELQAKLFGDALVLSDVEGSILENNLFGVDINNESVEIAKLSLWLRTAQPNRKLNDLNSNIKCGNSLIDDVAVAGDKAFNWRKEFSQVFEKGGFDVVIGNPPYVKIQNLKHSEIDWYKKNKKVAFKRIDISIMFFELSFHILKNSGILTFITSNQFTVAEYGRNARKYFLENFRIDKILDYGDLPIFENAITYVSIFTLSKNKKDDFLYQKVKTIEDAKSSNYNDFIKISINKLSEDNWIFGSDILKNILDKLNGNKKLHEIGKCNYGIVSGNDDVFILNNEDIILNKIENECLLPLLRAENCHRYSYVKTDLKILYPYELNKQSTVLLSTDKLEKLYPNTFNYLIKNKNLLEQRKDSRTTFENSTNWYSLTRFGQLESFNQVKIVFPGEQKRPKFGIDECKSGYSGARVFSITLSLSEINIKYVLGILNSKVIEFYIKNNFALKQGGYYSMSSSLVDKFPIPIKNNQNDLVSKVDSLLNENSILSETILKFQRSINRKFSLESLSNKLEDWYLLSYSDFIKELAKKKIKLSLSDEAEWEEYFNTESKKALELKSKIDSTDKEIDQMVYKLYDLTEEEIKIVEKNS